MGRRWRIATATYLLIVAGLFLLGRLHLDEDGVSFVPVLLATLPWSLAVTLMHLSRPIFLAITAYYDLPLFALSAFLNVGLSALFLACKSSE